VALKGILLAGGSGSRLYPLTVAISKQLMAVYDKPMIYYPLSTLMFAGIRDIMLISTPQHVSQFEELLGDGSRLGMHVSYAVQPRPEGLAQAFVIARDFVGGDRVSLALGDNLFYGDRFPAMVRSAANRETGATIFGYRVNDPDRYGVVELNPKGQAVSLEEKPSHPRSHLAVPGLYFYDNAVLDIARDLRPSARGELEITDVNRAYLSMQQLHVQPLGRGIAWLDTGTPQALLQAAHFVEVVQERQGHRIAAIEEVAYRMGFIDKEQLERLAAPLINHPYGQYLASIAEDADA
jgi:glucose-1-phosphate thymidylyltransferase